MRNTKVVLSGVAVASLWSALTQGLMWEGDRPFRDPGCVMSMPGEDNPQQDVALDSARRIVVATPLRDVDCLSGVAVASLGAMAVAAQPGGRPPMHGGPPFMDSGAMLAIGALLHADGLSDDQQQQMHAIMESGHATAEPLLDQLRTANQTLTDHLLGAETPSADTLSSAITQIETLRQQLVQQQVQTVHSLRPALTAAQVQQALQHSQQFPAPRGVVF